MRRRPAARVLAAGCVALCLAAGSAMGQQAGASAVLLQGLDKITARVSTFEAPLGQAVRFGTFEITARACEKTPPEEPPESAAFLEITEVQPDAPAQPLFTGWMYASSPAVSAVDHAVYDVWVIDCRKASNSAASSAGEN